MRVVRHTVEVGLLEIGEGSVTATDIDDVVLTFNVLIENVVGSQAIEDCLCLKNVIDGCIRAVRVQSNELSRKLSV